MAVVPWGDRASSRLATVFFHGQMPFRCPSVGLAPGGMFAGGPQFDKSDQNLIPIQSCRYINCNREERVDKARLAKGLELA